MAKALERRKPKYAEDVKAGMARLGGRSRSDLADDRARGAASPLSSKKMEKKGRRK
jgi:hypothetical protein